MVCYRNSLYGPNGAAALSSAASPRYVAGVWILGRVGALRGKAGDLLSRIWLAAPRAFQLGAVLVVTLAHFELLAAFFAFVFV